MKQKGMSQIIFNDRIIPQSQIFLTRKNVFGLINTRPCKQGHVLICSRRIVQKISQLTEIQTIDLFMTAQQVCKKLQAIYETQYDMTVQNGPDAGQIIFHCHIHLYPKHEANTIEWNQKVRTQEDIAKENQRYMGLFQMGVD